MFREQEVMFEWESGSVSAPLGLWVEQMLLAMPGDQQKQVLDAVIAEIERRNEILAKEAEEQDETTGDFDEEGVA